MVLGNAVCLVGYAVVLWRFFRKRIKSEFSHIFVLMEMEGNSGIG